MTRKDRVIAELRRRLPPHVADEDVALLGKLVEVPCPTRPMLRCGEACCFRCQIQLELRKDALQILCELREFLPGQNGSFVRRRLFVWADSSVNVAALWLARWLIDAAFVRDQQPYSVIVASFFVSGRSPHSCQD